MALGRSHGFATLSRHGDSALDRVPLEERLWHISPQPRQSRFIRPAQVPAAHRPRAGAFLVGLPLCSDLVLRSPWKSSLRRRWSRSCFTCYSRPTSHRCQTPAPRWADKNSNYRVALGEQLGVGRFHAAALSSFSAPRATILIALSGKGRCSPLVPRRASFGAGKSAVS